MLKYKDTDIVFQEIPDETTLAINISGCPCHCDGCHSQHLWDDDGDELNKKTIDKFLKEYGDRITCICFMGGDNDPKTINTLARHIKYRNYDMNIAWYSGRDEISNQIEIWNFDYIKIGHYDKSKGPLNVRTTNQIMYKIWKIYDENNHKWLLQDITRVFWGEKLEDIIYVL